MNHDGRDFRSKRIDSRQETNHLDDEDGQRSAVVRLATSTYPPARPPTQTRDKDDDVTRDVDQHTRFLTMTLPLAAAAVFAVGVMFNPELFNDPDTNWHLATGQLILRDHAVPAVDPFSWSAPGRIWHAHEWLSEVLMTAAWQLASWPGVAVLFGIALALILAMIAVPATRVLPLAGAVGTVAAAAAAMGSSTLARPHLLAYVLLGLWTKLLLRARRQSTLPPWWSLAILVLWANMHASFIIGVGIAAVFALEAFLKGPAHLQVLRKWALFGAACVAVTLITPHGVQVWLYPFEVSRMQSLPQIGEWRPLSINKHYAAIAYMAIVLVGMARLARRLGWVRITLISGLMVMAILHIRHLPVFTIVAGLVLLDTLDETNPAGSRTPGLGLALAIIGLGAAARLVLPLDRANADAYPVTAIAAVPAPIRALPVINHYNFGGALILNGIRPYIDDRANMYGDAHMREYQQLTDANPATFAAVVKRGKVGWLMLPPDSALGRLAAAQGWRRLHADRAAVIYLRPGLNVP